MLGSVQLKTIHSHSIFSFKLPYSSSLTFTKVNKVVYTLVSTQLRHLGQAFYKTKSLIAKIINNIELIRFIDFINGKSEKNKNKHIFGSFRFHYTWGSSHILPVPRHVFNECHVYYDPAWNSIVSAECDDVAEAELSGYLHWLEEQVDENSTSDGQDEIDKLADTFIASCYEKFKLEKDESYRRYQEMMARNV